MTAPYAPSFIVPSTPGQLSNTRGANTGADKISLTAKYLNPAGGTDLASGIRCVATRTQTQSQPDNTLVWDSGLVGNVGTVALPEATNVNGAKALIITPSGGGQSRVYVLGTGTAGHIYSAKFSGGSISGWRKEANLPNASDGSAVAGAFGAVYFNGWIHIVGGISALGTYLSSVYAAPVNSDGTLGAWVAGTSLALARAWPAVCLIQDGTSVTNSQNCALVVVGGSASGTAATTTTYYSGILAAGAYTGAWTASGNALGTAVTGAACVFDPVSNCVYVMGGFNGAAAIATVQRSVVVYTGGGSQIPVLSGVWANDANALPAARAWGSACIAATTSTWPSSALNTTASTIYFAGGTTGVTITAAGQQTNVYYATTNTAGTAGLAGAWTNSANALPTAVTVPGLASTEKLTLDPTNTTPALWSPLLDPNLPRVIVLGGTNGSAGTTAVNSSSTATQAGGANGAFVSGAAAALTAGQLGTGGVITNNADGSQTITFLHGAFGGAPVQTLADGDGLQYALYFIDQTGNDLSAAGATAIAIGQPPTVTGLAGSPANSPQPTLSFNYVAGAGGAGQNDWEITVVSGATVFDSGLRLDQAESVACNTAPLLATATGYTVTATVHSQDTPMPGSSNTGTQVITWTPSYTAPAVPTSVTATPDNTNGRMTVQWTNPGGSLATFNRVYYRLTGTSIWYLLVDNIAAVIGSAQSVNLYDQLAFNTGYDFAVSACIGASGALTGESALVTAAGATNVQIAPTVFSFMLHIAGQGASYSVALIGQGSPKIAADIERQAMDVFGAVAPTVRYGIKVARKIDVTCFVTTAATQQSLMNLLTQAQAGNVIYYRDAFGVMLTVGLDSSRGVEEVPTLYRYTALHLVEVLNVYSPSTTLGSAKGIPAQQSGSVVRQGVLEGAV